MRSKEASGTTYISIRDLNFIPMHTLDLRCLFALSDAGWLVVDGNSVEPAFSLIISKESQSDTEINLAFNDPSTRRETTKCR